MKLSDFETMVTNRGMRVAHREDISDFTVFIADGWSDKQEKFVTWWAIGTPEQIDIAQILEFDKYEDMSGLKIPSKREWRVKSAIEHVKEVIPNIRKTAIYEGK